MNSRLRGLATLCAAFVALLAGTGIALFRADAGEVPTLAPILERITPSVVNIQIKGRVEPGQQPLVNTLSSGASPPPERSTIQRSSASGVVFDAREGLIVTNGKVIEHADRVTVTLTDGRKLPATPIGVDPETDIALIKVEVTDLATIPLGDSDKLRVGDFLIAIGYPFDVGQTTTLGIVSALHRGGFGLSPV
jgi:S1-C subfamily serine protease